MINMYFAISTMPLTVAGSIITFLGLVIAGFIILRGRVTTETIENYEAAIKSFEARTKTQAEDITRLKSTNELTSQIMNEKIVKLEARLEIVETMPLQQLSGDYHIISDTLNLVARTLTVITNVNQDIVTSNKQILLNQERAAKILAKNTTLVAQAVSRVKRDLKES